MTKIMYSVPSDPTIVKVTITASCVTDGADPEIVRDPERRQRPRLGKASLRAERGGAGGHQRPAESHLNDHCCNVPRKPILCGPPGTCFLFPERK